MNEQKAKRPSAKPRRTYGARAPIPHIVKGHRLVDVTGEPFTILVPIKDDQPVHQFRNRRLAERAIMRTQAWAEVNGREEPRLPKPTPVW